MDIQVVHKHNLEKGHNQAVVDMVHIAEVDNYLVVDLVEDNFLVQGNVEDNLLEVDIEEDKMVVDHL
jgi:hypothetical protein